MERLDGESQLSFIKRMTELYSDKVIDAQEWASAVLGEEYRDTYSDEYVRRASTFFKIFLNKIDDVDFDIVPDGASEEYLQELKETKESIYKEKCKLNDLLREKRTSLREEARFENLCEVLKDGLSILKPIKLESGWALDDDVESKTAVLCLSDWHCGAIVDNQFNYYDVEEMKHRASIITEKAITYCNNHAVTDLVVEINGDMVDGLIHISSRVHQEEDVVQQVLTVSSVLAEVLNKLAPWFRTVKVYCSLGNHGRLTSNKKDSITKENFEMLIPPFLKEKLKDIKNITIMDSKGLDFLKYNIGDKVICMAHGQNDTLSKAVEDFSKIFKVVPDEVHLGHTHAYKDVNNCNVLVNVNGSLVGADDYALTIRKINEPAQNLIIYEPDRCVYSLTATE